MLCRFGKGWWLAAALVAMAQPASAREVLLRDEQGPVVGAQLAPRGGGPTWTTDAAGRVTLPDRLAGPLEIALPSGRRFERSLVPGTAPATIDLSAPGTPPPAADVPPGPIVLPPITVRASPLGGGVADLATPAAVLADEDLERRRRGTLGETLRDVPGVAATYFGPGASRPIIRGFDGPRVRVLSDGVDVLDASTVSPDHAVADEPGLARQIEILKGPATLLYGGGAIGGVVNVIDGRIPTAVPRKGYEGELDLRGTTNLGERAGAGGVTLGYENLAMRLEGLWRRADDYKAGGRFGDPPSRRVNNSFTDSASATIGGSWIPDWGYIGAAYTDQRNKYGIPSEETTFIKMHNQRLDVRGEINDPFGGIEKVRLRLAHVNYQHKEIEDSEVATIFKNKATDARVEVVHNPIAGLRGVVGVQGLWRDFRALGEEAFIAPTQTNSRGVFLLERYSWDSFHIEGGARFDWQSIDVQSDQPDRRHRALSASIGAVWTFAPGYSLGLSVSRSQRMPTAEELYADGPHIATGQFEIGNPDLDDETSRNIELTLRKRSGPLRFEVSIYRNAIRDFIFAASTGTEIDGLDVVNFTQRNAVFYGAEAEVKYAVTDWLDASVFGDYVRARTKDHENLPRMPPGRIGGTLEARLDGWQAFVQLYHVFAQDKVAPFETRTGGYNMLNAGVAYGGDTAGPLSGWQVYLRANNLLNEKAFVHTSFIKDSAPLPGLNVTLGARLTF